MDYGGVTAGVASGAGAAGHVERRAQGGGGAGGGYAADGGSGDRALRHGLGAGAVAGRRRWLGEGVRRLRWRSIMMEKHHEPAYDGVTHHA